MFCELGKILRVGQSKKKMVFLHHERLFVDWDRDSLSWKFLVFDV